MNISFTAVTAFLDALVQLLATGFSRAMHIVGAFLNALIIVLLLALAATAYAVETVYEVSRDVIVDASCLAYEVACVAGVDAYNSIHSWMEPVAK